MAVQVVSSDSKEKGKDCDGLVLVVDAAAVHDRGLEAALSGVAPELRQAVVEFAGRRLEKPVAGARLVFDRSAAQRVVLRLVAPKLSVFRRLEIARRSLAPLLSAKGKRIVVDLRAAASSGEAEASRAWADAFAAAFSAATFESVRYRKTPKPAAPQPELSLVVSGPAAAAVEQAVRAALDLGEGTNLVRRLAAMAGNDLTTDRYVELASDLAKKAGLKTEFVSFDKLKALGAGAFCAVAQGTKSRSGILKVHYAPKGAMKRVAFVGKGITYDTGGAQVKSGEHMFGMHGDMAGSAVALALTLWAVKTGAPFAASAYLAITDNQFTNDSYRPNDVVTSLSGKTIEVIDTDAEGRMVLADTLTLAGRDKPSLIVDFATLTGSCVRAIGTMYSGGYSNRKKLLSVVRAAGRASGERVWAFPNDSDYGRALKSTVADIKQCRLKGGVDHIEASYFLRQFVDRKIPYVHVDLAAIENEGGLAHVPTEGTGFGVRFGAELVRRAFS